MNGTIALGLIGWGILEFLAAVGVLPAPVGQYVGTYWPVLLIALGIEVSVRRLRRGRVRVAWPLIFLFLGVLLLLDNLGVSRLAGVRLWDLVAAAVLIYVGWGVLGFRSRLRRRLVNSWPFARWDGPHGGWRKLGGGDATPRWRSMGEIRYGDGPWTLSPLEIWHNMGSVRMNLATAIVPPGETAIEIHNGLGEIRVQVPHDVAVDVEARLSLGEVRLFGERYSGLNRNVARYVDPGYEEAPARIKIRIRQRLGEVHVARVDAR